MSGNPNFPPDLHILPSKNAYKEHDCQFDFRSQEDAIRTYGIAGRVWYLLVPG